MNPEVALRERACANDVLPINLVVVVQPALNSRTRRLLGLHLLNYLFRDEHLQLIDVQALEGLLGLGIGFQL